MEQKGSSKHKRSSEPPLMHAACTRNLDSTLNVNLLASHHVVLVVHGHSGDTGRVQDTLHSQAGSTPNRSGQQDSSSPSTERQGDSPYDATS